MPRARPTPARPPAPPAIHPLPTARSMSYSYASRHSAGRGGMSGTTLLAAKAAVASAALAAAASLARVAVPHLVSVAGAVVPRVWAAARFWFAPPYLFVTVHLIILVIWKLSDHKPHFHAQHKEDPWPVAQQHAAHTPAVAVHAAVEEVAPAVKEKELEFGAAAAYDEHMVMKHGSSPEFSPDSGGGDSCVTTESDEDTTSAPPSSSYYSVEARRSVAPVHERAAVLEREPSLPSQTVDGEGDDDDLDATWNAIMQKTRTVPAEPSSVPPPPAQQQQSPPPPRARDPSVGAEEMNRRFDDFIKKNRNSFRRQ